MLLWCAALERRDYATAASYYNPALGITAATMKSELNTLQAAGYFAYFSGPTIIDSELRGNRATVFTDFKLNWQYPNGNTFQYLRPQAFELIHVGTRSTIADDYFLRSALLIPIQHPSLPAPSPWTR